MDFRAKLLNHVQRLPLAFHDHYGAGDSVYCIQHDAPSIQYVVLQGILPLMIAAFTLAGMILISVQIDRNDLIACAGDHAHSLCAFNGKQPTGATPFTQYQGTG